MPDSMYDSLWKDTLDAVKISGYFPEDTFQSWVVKTSLFKIDESTAYVAYHTLITQRIISKPEVQELFEDTLSELYGAQLKIQYISQKEKEHMMPEVAVQERTQKLLKTQFHPLYTFENFVEGNSNAEAYAACLSCCTQNTHMFNPIMLYGNSGLGKTHLLHAIGNYLKKEKPEAKVFYVYSGDLVTILIDAMKTKNIHGNTVDQVKSQLIDNDYFLIDDIQNLKQSSSQEIFFTVYNELIAKNAQIVMTSDMHPTEIQDLQARLVSRFNSGLTINITKPELDTSKAILRKKIEVLDKVYPISEDVFDFLAKTFSSDVRSLESNLSKLIFNATLMKPDVIDLPFAQQVLEKVPVVMDVDEEVTLKKIKKAVTRFYGLSYKDIEGKSRQKNIMNARHVFVYLSRELLKKPYVAIGQELGNRDHTTIKSSYTRAQKLLKSDPAFQMAISKVKSILRTE